MKKLILMFILCISLFSCSTNDDVFTPVNIVPILVGKGSLGSSNSIPAQNVVFTESNSWNSTLALIDPIYIQTLFTDTNVNFNTHMVIATFDVVYLSYGHQIGISNITEYENYIAVKVIKFGGPSSLSAVVKPFYIVKIPKSTKPIVFE